MKINSKIKTNNIIFIINSNSKTPFCISKPYKPLLKFLIRLHEVPARCAPNVRPTDAKAAADRLAREISKTGLESLR